MYSVIRARALSIRDLPFRKFLSALRHAKRTECGVFDLGNKLGLPVEGWCPHPGEYYQIEIVEDRGKYVVVRQHEHVYEVAEEDCDPYPLCALVTDRSFKIRCVSCGDRRSVPPFWGLSKKDARILRQLRYADDMTRQIVNLALDARLKRLEEVVTNLRNMLGSRPKASEVIERLALAVSCDDLWEEGHDLSVSCKLSDGGGCGCHMKKYKRVFRCSGGGPTLGLIEAAYGRELVSSICSMLCRECVPERYRPFW